MGETNGSLATLIGSRICHDLISPIGAINNGLELMELAGNVQGPEIELITESVGNAGARIRFFRIAFGTSGEQMLGRDEIVSILDDIGRNSRRTVIWEPEIPRPRTEVRLAFLALLCCETAMPFDGTVRVRKEGYAWTITGESENLTIDDTLWDTLTNPEAPTALTPAQVQFALLPIVAADLGQKISLEKSQTEITIKI